MTLEHSEKHLLNKTETLVADSIEGLCYAYPHLRWMPASRVVYDANIKSIAAKQVTLVAGGGSGHEPAHAGSVGDGMLSAAVCGHVFASPSASQVLSAIERIQSPHGSLVIVKNYTGDCLHFGLAVERAKARGIKVAMVIVGDDIAIGSNKNKVGRRGMAAVSLVIKLAGALASEGASLEEVKAMADYAIQNSATLGVALDHCHVPGTQPVHLLPNEIEIGMGIHNEMGLEKGEIRPVKDLVRDMMDKLIDQEDTDRSYLRLPADATSRIVLLVNNLGGTAALELGVVVKEAVHYIHSQQQLSLERVYSGPFVTSLNMPGFSLTLLVVNDKMLSLLDHKVHVAGWPLAAAHSFSRDVTDHAETSQQADTSLVPQATGAQAQALERAIHDAAKAVISAEPEITHYDTLVGDGDCGSTFHTAATAVLQALPTYPLDSSSETVLAIAETIDHAVGGTSSAIGCIFLNALAAGLSQSPPLPWRQAAQAALESLKTYTNAREGDRTMMDCLIPFVRTLQQEGATLKDAIAAAEQGTMATVTLTATVGRTSYLPADNVQQAKVPDPGAWGLYILLKALDVES